MKHLCPSLNYTKKLISSLGLFLAQEGWRGQILAPIWRRGVELAPRVTREGAPGMFQTSFMEEKFIPLSSQECLSCLKTYLDFNRLNWFFVILILENLA